MVRMPCSAAAIVGPRPSELCLTFVSLPQVKFLRNPGVCSALNLLGGSGTSAAIVNSYFVENGGEVGLE